MGETAHSKRGVGLSRRGSAAVVHATVVGDLAHLTTDGDVFIADLVETIRHIRLGEASTARVAVDVDGGLDAMAHTVPRADPCAGALVAAAARREALVLFAHALFTPTTFVVSTTPLWAGLGALHRRRGADAITRRSTPVRELGSLTFTDGRAHQVVRRAAGRLDVVRTDAAAHAIGRTSPLTGLRITLAVRREALVLVPDAPLAFLTLIDVSAALWVLAPALDRVLFTDAARGSAAFGQLRQHPVYAGAGADGFVIGAERVFLAGAPGDRTVGGESRHLAADTESRTHRVGRGALHLVSTIAAGRATVFGQGRHLAALAEPVAHRVVGGAHGVLLTVAARRGTAFGELGELTGGAGASADRRVIGTERRVVAATAGRRAAGGQQGHIAGGAEAATDGLVCGTFGALTTGRSTPVR